MQKFLPKLKTKVAATYHTGDTIEIKDGEETVTLIHTNCGKTLYPDTVVDVSDTEKVGNECLACLNKRLVVDNYDIRIQEYMNDTRKRSAVQLYEEFGSVTECMGRVAQLMADDNIMVFGYEIRLKPEKNGDSWSILPAGDFATLRASWDKAQHCSVHYTVLTKEQCEYIYAHPYRLDPPPRPRSGQRLLR